MRVLNITSREAGQRLDKYLQKYFSEAPSSFLYKMLRKKNIVLNKKKADGSERLAEGDTISLFLADDTIEKFSRSHQLAPKKRLEVVYEDAQILVINKPVGMLSQKAKENDYSANEYIIRYLIEQHSLTTEDLKTFRPSICNRLDRNTSGLLLAGKTIIGLQQMSLLLKERTIKKYYLCLVAGHVQKGEHVRGYLHKNEKCNKVEICQEPGADAAYIETAYQPLMSNRRVSLLQVELITGKTHQIRSHLASLGHGIIGDPKYGEPRLNQHYQRTYGLRHQLLHAWKLVFPKLNGPFAALSQHTLEAAIPESFAEILRSEQLKGE